MMKSIDVYGKTEEIAVENALAQLGLTREDVEVEILELSKTSFLGLKSSPALVRVTYSTSDTAEGGLVESKVDTKKPEREKKSNETAAPKSKAIHKADKAVEKALDTENTSESLHSDNSQGSQGTSETERRPFGKATNEHLEIVKCFLSGLFEKMDVETSMSASIEEDIVSVSLTGSMPGALIGRRGETLDAIQHLTNYVVNRGSNSGRIRVNIDAENYRERRNETLANLAASTAARVIKNRKNLSLEPMNAYERHVVHAALQDHKQVHTFSVGNEPNRRIVVAYGSSGGGESSAGRGGRIGSRGNSRHGGFSGKVERAKSRHESPAEQAVPNTDSVDTKTSETTSAPANKYREWS